MLELTILFLVGIVAGFINIMAGGGSALSVPTMILLGYDPTIANGTNRLAILVEAGTGVAAFRRERLADFKTSWKLAWLTLPGGVLGAMYATQIDDGLFTRLLGLVLILIVISLLLPKPAPASVARSPAAISIAMFGIGFYGGFIQAGVGFLIMAALTHLMGLSLLRTNMHKVFIVMIFTLPSILIFAASGNIDWQAGAVLACGMAAGAWGAAHLAVRKGDKAVKVVLAVSLLILGAKLIFAP
ncbi:MAG: sulfite exporter TauE/SafE family protein [Thiotrichales bacterium]